MNARANAVARGWVCAQEGLALFASLFRALTVVVVVKAVALVALVKAVALVPCLKAVALVGRAAGLVAVVRILIVLVVALAAVALVAVVKVVALAAVALVAVVKAVALVGRAAGVVAVVRILIVLVVDELVDVAAIINLPPVVVAADALEAGVLLTPLAVGFVRGEICWRLVGKEGGGRPSETKENPLQMRERATWGMIVGLQAPLVYCVCNALHLQVSGRGVAHTPKTPQFVPLHWRRVSG